MAEPTPPAKMAQVPPKPEGNPAFRMMGLPRISKIKLPSRNWLIFLGITGSWITALSYDRYHKRRAQRKWCEYVSHLARETLPVTSMPRKITVFLEAPPGDNLRPAREHFHEYIKPILVAGSIDWEVIEGRREGEIRVGLAEKIRKLRKRLGETSPKVDGEEEDAADVEDLMRELRKQNGLQEWEGIGGELVVGRHAWKEYIRGLHEGWLGPLKQPEDSKESEKLQDATLAGNVVSAKSRQAASSTTDDPPPLPEASNTTDIAAPTSKEDTPSEPPSEPAETPAKSKSEVKAAYLPTAAYSTSPLAPSLPSTLPPSSPISLPHLLGFRHTPTRMYNFLTRRYLADETGAQVAALVLATHTRPYTTSESFVSADNPDNGNANDASPSASISSISSSSAPHDHIPAVVRTNQSWEQTAVLADEEAGWHKSVWKTAPTEPSSDTASSSPTPSSEKESISSAAQRQARPERPWLDPIILDDRIGSRMRAFELPDSAATEATALEETWRQKQPNLFEQVRDWLGWKPDMNEKGWKMGEVGDDNS